MLASFPNDSSPENETAGLDNAADTASIGNNGIEESTVDEEEDKFSDEWEVEKIIGEEEDEEGVPCYLVVWAPTLIRQDNLGNMEELVQDWEDRKRMVALKMPRAEACEPQQTDQAEEGTTTNPRKRKFANLGEKGPGYIVQTGTGGEMYDAWEFVRILDSRECDSGIEYKIQWTEPWRPTWQPAVDLKDNLDEIVLFHQSMPDRPGPPTWG